MAEPLVSVVTPVYNGATYLAECIESVLAQTYQRWQYTIVNNRSTDATLAIAETYAARDPRVRVITNAEFVGMLPNHNIAWRQVDPDAAYVKMVHADDWLFPNCLTEMVALAEAHPQVGIVGAYRLRGAKVELDGLPYPSSAVPGREVCRAALLRGVHVFGSPTATLLRADLVRGRERLYNEQNIHADTEVCYDLLRHCDWGFVHQVLTFTRTHPGQNTAYTSRINSFMWANLHDVITYGPAYLTPAEVQERTVARLSQYYTFLGRALLQRRDAAFWRFHREGLKQLGLPLNGFRLVQAAAGQLLDRALNPKRTIEGALRRGT